MFKEVRPGLDRSQPLNVDSGSDHVLKKCELLPCLARLFAEKVLHPTGRELREPCGRSIPAEVGQRTTVAEMYITG